MKCSWCERDATHLGSDGTWTCGQGQGDGMEPHSNIGVVYSPLTMPVAAPEWKDRSVLCSTCKVLMDKDDPMVVESEVICERKQGVPFTTNVAGRTVMYHEGCGRPTDFVERRVVPTADELELIELAIDLYQNPSSQIALTKYREILKIVVDSRHLAHKRTDAG